MRLKLKNFNNLKYEGGLSQIKNINNPIKLSANESALGPSKKAIAAFIQHNKKIFRYPDGNSNDLIKTISKNFKLNTNNIIVGNGSDDDALFRNGSSFVINGGCGGSLISLNLFRQLRKTEVENLHHAVLAGQFGPGVAGAGLGDGQGGRVQREVEARAAGRAAGRQHRIEKRSSRLRQQRDRDALRAALADGTVDALVSDHSPVEGDAKALPFAEAEPGATGLELLLSLSLKWANDMGQSVVRALDVLTAQPAKLLGLEPWMLSSEAGHS